MSILARFHPFNTALNVHAHVFAAVVMYPSMTRQNPFEVIIQKFFHRTRLRFPRIPADAPKSRQHVPIGRPRQMIAGEEILISIKQDHVSAGVTGNWNRHQIMIESDRIVAAYHVLDPKSSSAIIGVHHALAAKLFREAGMIGNVITMRQKHQVHSAGRFDLFYELRGEAWRVNQNIAAFGFRSRDQITPRAKAGLGREATEVNILGDILRKCIDADARLVMLDRSNRGGRTSDQRHQCAFDFASAFRLMMNDRSVVILGEGLRCDLPAGVAVDAG